jgi:hypothetical protein
MVCHDLQIAFNRKVRQGIIKSGDPEAGEDDPMAQMMSMWAVPFKPNLMNTVVFLVETSQIIAVLFVNYKGASAAAAAAAAVGAAAASCRVRGAAALLPALAPPPCLVVPFLRDCMVLRLMVLQVKYHV